MPDSSEDGVAMVELAITVAFLLFIALAGLEFASSLKYLEVASVLSREAAGMAFRDCSAETDEDILKSCLNTVKNKIENAGEDVIGPTSVVLTLYTYAGAPGTCSPNPDPNPRFVGTGSKLELIEGVTHGSKINTQVICENRVVIVSEIFIQYTPLLPIKLLPIISKGTICIRRYGISAVTSTVKRVIIVPSASVTGTSRGVISSAGFTSMPTICRLV